MVDGLEVGANIGRLGLDTAPLTNWWKTQFGPSSKVPRPPCSTQIVHCSNPLFFLDAHPAGTDGMYLRSVLVVH